MMGIFMADEQAAPAQDAGGGDGGIEQVLQAIGDGLAKVNEAMASAQGAPEEAKSAFAAAQQAFQQGLDALQAGDSDQGQAPSQTTTPEQGGNPNAVPMSMGRPG
jgi:phytoene/squalene synthetase